MEYIGIIIAAAGVAVSMYYSNRNLKASIVEQEQRREADMLRRQESAVRKAEKDTERHTQIMERLGVLMERTETNNHAISELKTEVKKLSETQVANVRDVKTAFNRIEKIETQLGALHREHRERCGKC